MGVRGATGAWALALLLGACNGSKIDPVTASAGFRQLPADQVIVGFQQYVTQAGVNKAIMLGDTAYIFEDSSLAKVKTVRLTLYDDKGAVSARVTSKTGDVNSATQAMIARGNVVLITSDGQRIETEELHYDPQTHRVWSNVHTTMRKPGSVSSGTAFDADDKFQNVRIIGARSTGGAMRIQF